MTTAELLHELESLAHAQRLRRLVALGNDARNEDAPARAMIEELSGSDDAWRRSLALGTVFGSRDAALALRLLSDPSRVVRAHAAGLVARWADDGAATEALLRTEGRRDRQRLVMALVRRGRSGVVDGLVSRAAEDGSLVDFVPYGSPAIVDRLAPLFRDKASLAGWYRLATHHPGIAAGLVETQLAAGHTHRLAWQLATVLRPLARTAPDRALELTRSALAAGEALDSYVFADAWEALARQRPAQTFDLARTHHEATSARADAGIFRSLPIRAIGRKLGAERLGWLARHAHEAVPDGRHGVHWFLSLGEPERAAVLDGWLAGDWGAAGAWLFRFVPADGRRATEREQAFERWSAAARNLYGCIALDRLAQLPHDLRRREALRHLERVAELQSSPRARLPYASLLPFDEAKARLASFLGHPDADVRAGAGNALIGTVTHARASLEHALEYVKARKYEQDPVRRVLIGTLAGLSPAAFRKEHLPPIGTIVQDALDAADCSSETAAALERLVTRVFPLDPAWGAPHVARVLATRGMPSSGAIARMLSRREAAALLPSLRAVVGEWRERERHAPIVWLAWSLGDRLRELTPVLEGLAEVANGADPSLAATGLALLALADGPRLDRTVERLVRADASVILLTPVARHLARHRQDLLGPYLDERPMTGRFAHGNSTWAASFDDGFVRWTSAQSGRFEQLLARVAGDPRRDLPSIRAAIRRLRDLAWAPGGALLALAADPRPPVLELALESLPWLDRAQGLPVLLAALGDHRARHAIHALRRAFAELPRAQAIGLLREVPLAKVTVAKEAVRLLGEFGGAGAYDELLAFGRKSTHRDVRVAWLRALWNHLDREPTWDAFAAAAADPDWVVATRLADLPMYAIPAAQEGRWTELFARLVERPEPQARHDFLRRATALALADRDRRLFSALVDHSLRGPFPEFVPAMRAVLVRATETDAPLVTRAFATLRRDRRKWSALMSLLKLGRYKRAPHVLLARGAFDAMEGDALALAVRIGFAPEVLDEAAFCAFLHSLAAAAPLHADAVAAACGAVVAFAHPEQIEALLRPNSAPELRRVALAALVHAARPEHGWTPERLRRLEFHRADPSPLVAGAALHVFPPEELPARA